MQQWRRPYIVEKKINLGALTFKTSSILKVGKLRR